jgi:hypothetical protein
MQSHYFYSKTWQYLTLEEIEAQTMKDNIPAYLKEYIEKLSAKKVSK